MNTKNVILTATSAIALSLVITFNLSNKATTTEVEAAPVNNVIYLNKNGVGMFAGEIKACFYYVEDDVTKAYASGLMMKPVPNNFGIYRVTMPSDAPYNQCYFYACETGTDVLWAETQVLDIPSNKNMYVLDQSKEVPGTPTPCTEIGDWSSFDGDTPSEGDGYYLVGTKTNWKFKDAIKLTSGTHGDKVELLQYEASKNEEFNIRSYIEDEEQYYGDKYQVGESAKAVNIFLDNEDHFVVDDYVLPPQTEGFYISGTFDTVETYDYLHSIKMSDVSGDYVAEYRGLLCLLGDSLKVRNFSYERHPWEVWATLSSEQDSTIGALNGDSFAFTSSGTYDLFVKEVDDSYEYIVKPHVEAFTVDLVCCYYNGAALGEMEFIPAQVAYAGETFTPTAPEMSYKYYLGAYYDEACTVKYDPQEIVSNCKLYLKYIKQGYYYTKGGRLNLENVLATGVSMDTSDVPNDGWAHVYLTVEANEQYDFGYFKTNGGPQGLPAAGVDVSHPLVEYNYNKYLHRFLVKGTYHIIHNNGNKLEFYDASGEPYINKVSPTIEIDSDNHVTTELSKLKSNWSSQKDLYNRIEDKTGFTSVGFKFTENPTNIYEEFMNKYYLAIYLYGSAELENYIFPSMDPVVPHPYPTPDPVDPVDPVDPTPTPEPSPEKANANTGVIVGVSVGSGTALLAGLGAFFFIKKRKAK